MTAMRIFLIALATVVVGWIVVQFLAVRQPPMPWDGGRTSDQLRYLEPPTVELSGGFPRTATWIGPEIRSPGIVEVLPSWNADCPPGTGIRVYGRVFELYTGAWSPWVDFGYWGRVPPPVFGESFADGHVAVDILELTRRKASVQFRVDFFSYTLDDTAPSIDRFAVVLRKAGFGQERERTARPIDLPVPFIAQRSAGDRIGGEICSATSVTMVAAYHGIKPTLVENALAIYDTEHDLFGNWNRAVQRAAELGLAGHLERFSQWSQVEAHLHAGRPIVASINFEAGQCPSFVMDSTDGHLIVVRGITTDGAIIVNDGASAQRGARAIYDADELRTAWFENAGGVGYVIYPRDALP